MARRVLVVLVGVVLVLGAASPAFAYGQLGDAREYPPRLTAYGGQQGVSGLVSAPSFTRAHSEVFSWDYPDYGKATYQAKRSIIATTPSLAGWVNVGNSWLCDFGGAIESSGTQSQVASRLFVFDIQRTFQVDEGGGKAFGASSGDNMNISVTHWGSAPLTAYNSAYGSSGSHLFSGDGMITKGGAFVLGSPMVPVNDKPREAAAGSKHHVRVVMWASQDASNSASWNTTTTVLGDFDSAGHQGPMRVVRTGTVTALLPAPTVTVTGAGALGLYSYYVPLTNKSAANWPNGLYGDAAWPGVGIPVVESYTEVVDASGVDAPAGVSLLGAFESATATASVVATSASVSTSGTVGASAFGAPSWLTSWSDGFTKSLGGLTGPLADWLWVVNPWSRFQR